MVRAHVGSVASLWRYPVKSMLGEELQASAVTARGVLGDRAYALLDVETGKVASAKNPRKWAKLLDFHASFVDPPQTADPLPPVTIDLPNGTAITSESPETDAVLSELLGREVQMLASAPDAACLDQYWPPVEGTAHQDAITELALPPGTFFDSCFIHILTTATLNQLQTLYPDGQFKPQRFRPNLVIAPTASESSFLENDWVGGVLAIGDSVRLSIDTVCPRCVVTTLAQGDLPQDLNILRTTARHNNVIAGIRTSVVHGGMIHADDPIWLESAA